MSAGWPEPDVLTEIHERLCAGDPVAVSDFLTAVLDPLVAHLRRYRPDADEHACVTAAEDTLLDLIHDPTLYDPARRTLVGYLRMSAEGDLLNELAKERRHRRNRDRHECVELAPDRGNSSAVGGADDMPSFDDPAVAAEIASFTPVERAVFELMHAGERATAAYVPVLKIEHLPEDERRRAVKRAKDRIVKRLQRAGGNR